MPRLSAISCLYFPKMVFLFIRIKSQKNRRIGSGESQLPIFLRTKAATCGLPPKERDCCLFHKANMKLFTTEPYSVLCPDQKELFSAEHSTDRSCSLTAVVVN